MWREGNSIQNLFWAHRWESMTWRDQEGSGRSRVWSNFGGRQQQFAVTESAFSSQGWMFFQSRIFTTRDLPTLCKVISQNSYAIFSHNSSYCITHTFTLDLLLLPYFARKRYKVGALPVKYCTFPCSLPDMIKIALLLARIEKTGQ